MLIDRNQSLVMVIDVQERFIPHIYKIDRIIKRIELLLKAAKLLDIPVITSEQYPKGLGATVASLQAQIEGSTCLPKTEFSCWRNDDLQNAIKASGKQHIILTGIEAHVCVMQTAIKLKENGYNVFVAKDTLSSRHKDSTKLAIKRMENHNIEIVNCEMVVTEWCESSSHPAFKEISNLIK